MSEIFISYAREDSQTAELLASALRERGWSVWSDRNIPIGKNYNEIIARELDSAKCIIVIWSKHSVSSRYVLAEGEEAWSRGALIPISVDASRPPLPFRQIQSANLMGWHGDRNRQEFLELLSSISQFIGHDVQASNYPTNQECGANQSPVIQSNNTTPATKSYSHPTIMFILLVLMPTIMLSFSIWYISSYSYNYDLAGSILLAVFSFPVIFTICLAAYLVILYGRKID